MQLTKKKNCISLSKQIVMLCQVYFCRSEMACMIIRAEPDREESK